MIIDAEISEKSTTKIKKKNPAAVALGRMRSAAKAAASRKNGLLGGRPRKGAKTKEK